MIDRTVIEQVRSRQAHRRSQRVGSDAELVVRSRLILRGLVMVERIHVGWRKIAKRWVRCARVSGDWRAIAPGGISVLVEVKFRGSGTHLVFSDLEPHQRQALDAHHVFGGISLLAWVSPTGVALLRWPVPGFMRGSSITAADAAALEWKP